MATYSSILAWEIEWTEEPGGLQSMGSQKNQKTTYRLNHNCYSCLLFGAFSSLTLKVIIDRYMFIAILNLAFQLILYFFFVPFLFFLFFLLWFNGFLLRYAWVLFFLVLWIYCFLFMVILVFKYVNTLLYLFGLCW